VNQITAWYEFVLAQMAAGSYLDDPSETDDQADPFDFKDEDSLVLRLQNGANHYDHIQGQEQTGEPLSWPAFAAVVGAYWLMVAKPL
tara:strand:- start:111 stop:371 length:261 start_codon:yes stop_codon:yes gene_type:complete